MSEAFLCAGCGWTHDSGETPIRIDGETYCDACSFPVSALTPYQKREVRHMRANGWAILRIHRLATEDNPWATIEVRKGTYQTKAAMPATLADERFMTGAKS